MPPRQPINSKPKPTGKPNPSAQRPSSPPSSSTPQQLPPLAVIYPGLPLFFRHYTPVFQGTTIFTVATVRNALILPDDRLQEWMSVFPHFPEANTIDYLARLVNLLRQSGLEADLFYIDPSITFTYAVSSLRFWADVDTVYFGTANVVYFSSHQHRHSTRPSGFVRAVWTYLRLSLRHLG